MGTELSTIFLCLRNLIYQTKVCEHWNTAISAVFVLVFVYMRLIKCGYYSLFEMKKYSKFLRGAMLFLLALNVYWAVKIFHKAYEEWVIPS